MPQLILVIIVLVMLAVGVWMGRRLFAPASTTSATLPSWTNDKDKTHLQAGWEYCCLTIEKTQQKNLVYVHLKTYDKDSAEDVNLGDKTPQEAEAIRQNLKYEGWTDEHKRIINYVTQYYYRRLA